MKLKVECESECNVKKSMNFRVREMITRRDFFEDVKMDQNEGRE